MEDSLVEDSNSQEEGTELEPMPANAFLIEENARVFLVNKHIINIGRRIENHLVIDDPRVSRQHAQLRVIHNRFVLIDLESTGGTFVNGKRIGHCVIYPGDVISLAGVHLVFKLSNTLPRPDLKETGRF